VLVITSHEALMAGRLADGYVLADRAVRTADVEKTWRARALAGRAWCGFFSGLGSDAEVWADAAEVEHVLRQLGDERLVTELDTFRAALTTQSRSIAEGTSLDADVVARSAPLSRAALSGLVFQAYGTALTDLRLDHRLAIAHEALSQSRAVGHRAFEVMALAAIGTRSCRWLGTTNRVPRWWPRRLPRPRH
jgi:hypothetical protein